MSIRIVVAVFVLSSICFAQKPWSRIEPGIPSGGPGGYWMQEYSDGIYCSSDGAGMYRSTDDGRTWTQWGSSLTSKQIYRFVRTSTNRWIVTYIGGSMCYSDDNGLHWSAVAFSDPSIETIPLKRIPLITKKGTILIGCSKNIIASKDNGTTWTKCTMPAFTSSVRNLVEFSNGDILASVGNHFCSSSDDGATWIDAGFTPNKLSLLNLHCLNDKLVVANASNEVLYSADRGATWSSLNYDLPTTGATMMYEVLPFSDGFLINLLENGIWKLSNGTTHWKKVADRTQIPWYMQCLFQTTSGAILANNWYACLRSTNNGDTWQNSNTGINYERSTILATRDDGTMYVSSNTTDVYSMSGSSTFTKKSSVPYVWLYPSRAVLSQPSEQLFLLAGSEVVEYKIIDGTYRQTTDLNSFTNDHLIEISDIACVPQVQPVLYALASVAAANASDSDHFELFISADGAKTWVQSSARPTLPTNTAEPHMVVAGPASLVCISDEFAVRTTDDGTTWSVVPISGAVAIASNKGYCAIATNDSVYISNDAFAHWFKQPLELKDPVSNIVITGGGYSTFFAVVSTHGELVDFWLDSFMGGPITRTKIAQALPFTEPIVSSLSAFTLAGPRIVNREYTISTYGMGMYRLGLESGVTEETGCTQNVYPQPADDYIHLICNENEISRLRLIDCYGRDCSMWCGVSTTGTDNECTVDIRLLPSGVYAIVTSGNDGQHSTPFIVAR